MNFDLSDEQRLLQDTVGQVLSDHCSPAHLRALAEGESQCDTELWKALGELGVTGLHVPEVYGGAGLEILDLACVAETLGYHAAPGPFLGHALAIRAIALGASEAQRQRWLPALAAGDAIGTIAFAEEGGSWRPEDWQMPARGNVSGAKVFVPHAGGADVIVVGLSGGRLGIVEKDADGFAHAPIEGADWTRPTGRVECSESPCDLFPENPAVADQVVDAGLVLLAADAVGGAQRLLDLCVEYALTREQFGVKIGSFQALKHQLAEMALQVEPNRGLYWYAAHLQDRGDQNATRLAAIAKAHSSDRFVEVARSAIEVHGGIGFTWECDAQIWFKRALFDRALLGAPREQRRRQAQLGGW